MLSELLSCHVGCHAALVAFSSGFLSLFGEVYMGTDRRVHDVSFKGQPILSAAKSAQAGTTRAEPPLSFRAIKDLAPQKRRLSRLRSDNRLFGVPVGQMSDR